MAVQWSWQSKMGKVTLKQKDRKTDKAKNFTINLYSNGNCLAVFLYEYKEEDKEKYQFLGFLEDKKHCDRMIKDNGKLLNFLWGNIVSIQLNMFFKSSQTLLQILTKNGYRVQAYYQEPKTM